MVSPIDCVQKGYALNPGINGWCPRSIVSRIGYRILYTRGVPTCELVYLVTPVLPIEVFQKLERRGFP